MSTINSSPYVEVTCDIHSGYKAAPFELQILRASLSVFSSGGEGGIGGKEPARTTPATLSYSRRAMSPVF